MNAGTIVGYVTQPNGSPISGADIWISQAGEFGSKAEIMTAGDDGATENPAAKTDSRGYFQLPFAGCETDAAENFGISGKLNISVSLRKGGQANSKGSVASETGFQVKGYLIKAEL